VLNEFPTLARQRLQVFSISCRFFPPHTCQPCFVLDPLLGFVLQGFAPLVKPFAVSSAVSLLALGCLGFLWHQLQSASAEANTNHR
jgi:hypothetical protein